MADVRQMKCDSSQPLHFARDWMRRIPHGAHADIAVRFLALSRRMKRELDGHLPKACAGACLMIAVKVEDGMCHSTRRLSGALGVSSQAIVDWELKVLQKLDWNLALVWTESEAPAPEGRGQRDDSSAVDWNGVAAAMRRQPTNGGTECSPAGVEWECEVPPAKRARMMT